MKSMKDKKGTTTSFVSWSTAQDKEALIPLYFTNATTMSLKPLDIIELKATSENDKTLLLQSRQQFDQNADYLLD